MAMCKNCRSSFETNGINKGKEVIKHPATMRPAAKHNSQNFTNRPKYLGHSFP